MLFLGMMLIFYYKFVTVCKSSLKIFFVHRIFTSIIKQATVFMASVKCFHLMVVDSDDDVVLATAGMIKHIGHTVYGETRSIIALKTFSEHPYKFDLAIIEPVMPELGGIELAVQFNHLRPGFPILFYAGYLDQRSGAAIKSAGVGPTIFKPLSLKELKKAIEQRLG